MISSFLCTFQNFEWSLGNLTGPWEPTNVVASFQKAQCSFDSGDSSYMLYQYNIERI